MGRRGSGRRAEQRRRVKNRAKRLVRLAAASLMLYAELRTWSYFVLQAKKRQLPRAQHDMDSETETAGDNRDAPTSLLLSEWSPWSPRRARTLSYRPDSLALATELKHCEALGSGGDAPGRLDALLGKDMPTKLSRAPALFSDAARRQNKRASSTE